MADQPLLGPDGQPLKNPFFAQQGQSKTDISVNIKPAEEAFAKLNKILDEAGKNFGIAFQRATAENLKAQENFYKYIGDRESERRVAVERLKRAAIDSVNEELKAQLASYDEQARASKMSQEQINRGKLDLATKTSRQIADIEREAAKKASPGMFGRAVEGAQNIGSRIGGPIGGVVSGIANLVAAPEIAIPAAIIGAIIETMNTRAAFTKTGIGLQQAGLGGVGSANAQDLATGMNLKMFSGLNRALSQEEQRAIMGTMAGSSTLTRQAGTGVEGIRGNLGLFANVLPDVAKEMELFADSSKSLGTSQHDLKNIFFQTSKSSKDLQITQLDAIATQMTMQKALRNLTNDGTVAASVLDNVGSFFKEIGKSEGERQRFTLGVANAGANLSLSNMVGMLAFTKGIGVTSPAMQSALFGKGGIMGAEGGGPFGLMGEFFMKVGGKFKNPMEKLFAADALNQQFGLGLQTQDLPKFFDLASRLQTGNISKQDFGKQVAELSKQSKALTIEGMDNLNNIVGPIQQMEKLFTNFWTEANNLFTRYFGAPKGGGPAVTSQSLSSQRNMKGNKPTASHFDVDVSGR